LTEYRYFREDTEEQPLEYRVGLRPGDRVELLTLSGEWVSSGFEDVDHLLDETQHWPFKIKEVDSL
jgi:hypothetical protein